MPIVLKIEILMDDAGKVSVTGPIDNRMLAYGLLELAKEVVYENFKSKQQRIVAPTSESIQAFSEGKKM